MHHIRKAFTLIELLVVMGVILLLLGIILPVVNRSLEQARTAKCLANQHQVFSALLAFAKDNNECCPGSSGIVATGGPGTTQYYGVGQLISCADSLAQSTLEGSSQSILVTRHYLQTSAIFHCPQQDTEAGIELTYSGCSATFQYVFNQYFVGDMQCAPGGVPITANYSPQYSGAFPDLLPITVVNAAGVPTIAKEPITLIRAASVASRCVLITEDGVGNPGPSATVQDSTQEYNQMVNGVTVYYVHATPWHAVRQHKPTIDALPFIIADATVCTYVDGHTEMDYVTLLTGTTIYGVASDNGKPTGQPVNVNLSSTGLPR